MKILGLDPGTAITGFGIISATTQEDKKCLIQGHIKTSKDLDLAERLKQIQDDLLEIINKYKPDYAAVEELFFCKNVTTAISVSHARGVLLANLAKHKIPIFEYTPLQVKQGITGYGKASKRDVQEMVKRDLNLSEIPKPDDTADALALTIICLSEVLKKGNRHK